MDPIKVVEDKLSRTHPLVLCGALLAVSVARAGVWQIPNISSLNTLALNPFVNPYGGQAQYLFANWLGPFIAWSLGIQGQWPFTLLHAGFSAAFLFVTAIWLFRALPMEEWRKAICIFAILPVSSVHLYWIGYDSLTLALMALGMTSLRRPWLAILPGIGLGLQHFEQGLIAFTALLLVLLVLSRSAPSKNREILGAVAVLGGIIVGKLALRGLILAEGITVDYDRSAYLVDTWRVALTQSWFSLPTLLTSFLGIGWVFVLHYIGADLRRWILGGVLLLAIVVGCTALDNTRVFACVTFPSLAYCLLASRDWLEKVSFNLVAVLLLAWLASPWLFMWGSKPRLSVLPYDAAMLSHNAIGWPGIPEHRQRSSWPFSP